MVKASQQFKKKGQTRSSYAIENIAVRAQPEKTSGQKDHEASAYIDPYDEHLLDRSRTQWQFGDWDSLARLDLDILQHHPDRAKLALLAAAGRMHTGQIAEARPLVRKAQEWGASKELVSQVLVAGVHHRLGRASALAGQQPRALQHFESALALGTPGGEARLLARARLGAQLDQLGLPPAALNANTAAPTDVALSPTTLQPLTSSIQTLAETLTQTLDENLSKQKAELGAQLKNQADELIRVRKFLDSSLKKEVANAAKQIEAFVGLQSYFANGELPSINLERHSWPISPDFALYLIALIETHPYDLIIEFGSGISTVIIARTLAKMAPARTGKPPVAFLSFDHLERYYQQTLAQLQQAGLADRVQLAHTPLRDWLAPNGQTYAYYECNTALAAQAAKQDLAGLRVLVVVDGPPAATGPHARYPAGPLILQHFGGATIDLLLDDYIRDDEKQIAQLWQADIAAAGYSVTKTEQQLEKDACLLAIRPPSATSIPTP